jgi:hypothetical protein
MESNIEDGKIGFLMPEQLMVRMMTKYKALVVKGEWNAPTAEDEKIIAMQAQIDTFSMLRRRKQRRRVRR